MSTTIIQSYLGAIANKKHAFAAGGNVSGQAISHNTTTTIDLDTVHFDSGGNFSTSTNGYTAPVNGIYFFHGQVLYANDSTFNAGERTDIRIYKDNALIPLVTTIYFPDEADNYTAFFHAKMNGIMQVNAGQVMTMRIYQNTGETQNLYAASGAINYTSFSGYLIEPT